MLKVTQLYGFNVSGGEITLRPDIVGSGWQDSMVETLGGNTSGWQNYNMRQVISPPALSIDGAAVRVVFEADDFLGATLDDVYIGEQATSGDAYDMKASNPSPTQIKVSGAGSFSVPVGLTVTSDRVDFPITTTKSYVIAIHFAATPNTGLRTAVNSKPGMSSYYGSTGASEANTANVGVYTGPSTTRGVKKLQVETRDEIFYPPVLVSPDPDWSSVVLLTGFDGTHGSTVVIDQSSKAHGAATVAGTGSISTTQQKFGTTFRFIGSTSARWADHADWNFGSGNFTIELFFRIDAVTGIQQLIGQWGASGNFGWRLWTNNQFLNWNVSTTGVNNVADMTVSTLTANTWCHVCVDYDGVKYRLYKDGVMIASAITPRTLFDSTVQLALGSNSGASDYLTGYMDEVRISKGIARYHSDSGFTVPLSAYPRS